MAMVSYVKVEGQTQGHIKGSVTQKGREDLIMVLATTHSVVSPRDMATGLSTGKRQHKPITLTVEIDKATPLLYNVLVNNENLKTVKIMYWSTGSVQAGKAAAATGKEYQHYTITLTNANIASIDYRQPHTKNAEMARLMEYTDVSFVYEKIEWSWTDGGITAEDSWESPVI